MVKEIILNGFSSFHSFDRSFSTYERIIQMKVVVERVGEGRGKDNGKFIIGGNIFSWLIFQLNMTNLFNFPGILFHSFRIAISKDDKYRKDENYFILFSIVSHPSRPDPAMLSKLDVKVAEVLHHEITLGRRGIYKWKILFLFFSLINMLLEFNKSFLARLIISSAIRCIFRTICHPFHYSDWGILSVQSPGHNSAIGREETQLAAAKHSTSHALHINGNIRKGK